MNRTFLTLFLLFVAASLPAQKEATIWYFGKKAGLDFRSGIPVPLHDGELSTNEGCATMNDKDGNLLFYTNGENVWNKQHQIMPNGAGLMGGYSSTQSSIVIPFPDNDSLYYVFTTAQEKSPNGFRYSVVDMKRNGGLGDVTIKNVLILNNVYEKVTAVKQRNCPNYWVVTPKWDSDEYYSYLVTPAGIGSPVISKTGIFVGGSSTSARGQLKFSPDGRKVAAAYNITYDFVELFDFDYTTGKLSNAIKLVPNTPALETYSLGAYGLEFSPNSQLLYVSSTYAFSYPSRINLYQYNITSNNAALIEASKKLIDDKQYVYGMQLGPDKKIYVATFTNITNVIDNPDIEGTGCGYIRNAIDLGVSGEGDFPAFIQSFFTNPIIATGNCEFQHIDFSLQNSDNVTSVEWDFGDPASGTDNTSSLFTPTHLYSAAGSYLVRLVLHANSGCMPDTVYKQVQAGPLKIDLGNDTILCKGDTLKLSAYSPNASYLWSNGSTGSTIKVVQPGKYWAKAYLNNFCLNTDTIEVSYNNLPVFSLGKDTVICDNSEISLSPQTALVNMTCLWSTGATTSQIKVRQPGIYWLAVSDLIGCTTKDSINVSLRSLPKFSLGNDTSLCQTSLPLKASVTGADSYQWSTGDNAPVIYVNSSGIYWASVTKEQCSYSDTIQIQFKPYPVVTLGNDTVVCEGTTFYLDAQNSGSTYLWNDHSSGQTLIVNKPGIYTVKVTKNGCISGDTIEVRYDQKPSFSLGPDQLICSGQQITLSPFMQSGASPFSYTWSNGATGPTCSVRQPGTYALQITNHCGSSNDNIVIKKGVCKLLIPNAFTPNDDGHNDVFKASFGENVSSYKLEVYNRWGQKLFESADINQGWNGRFHGQLQSEGAYIWVIRFRTNDIQEDQILKGTVMLIR